MRLVYQDCKLLVIYDREYLTSVDVSGNQLESIDSVMHLENLQELNADCNRISRVWLERGLMSLQILSLNGNKELGNVDFEGMGGLRWLSVEKCGGVGLERAEAAHRLEVLNLSHNIFTKLPDCVAAFKGLRRLDMRGNLITSGGGVMKMLGRGMDGLTCLDLRNNPVTELFYPSDEKALSDEVFVKRTCWRAGVLLAVSGLVLLDGVEVGERERGRIARSYEKLRRGVKGSIRASKGSLAMSKDVVSAGAMGIKELEASGEDSLFKDWRPVSYPIEGGGGENLVLRVSRRGL